MDTPQTHYQKYKETILKSTKKWQQQPENIIKRREYQKAYRQRCKQALDTVKQLESLLEQTKKN